MYYKVYYHKWKQDDMSGKAGEGKEYLCTVVRNVNLFDIMENSM